MDFLSVQFFSSGLYANSFFFVPIKSGRKLPRSQLVPSFQPLHMHPLAFRIDFVVVVLKILFSCRWRLCFKISNDQFQYEIQLSFCHLVSDPQRRFPLYSSFFCISVYKCRGPFEYQHFFKTRRTLSKDIVIFHYFYI